MPSGIPTFTTLEDSLCNLLSCPASSYCCFSNDDPKRARFLLRSEVRLKMFAGRRTALWDLTCGASSEAARKPNGRHCPGLDVFKFACSVNLQFLLWCVCGIQHRLPFRADNTHSIAAAAASCSAGGATAPSSPDCSDVDESRDDDSEDDELELVCLADLGA